MQVIMAICVDLGGAISDTRERSDFTSAFVMVQGLIDGSSQYAFGALADTWSAGSGLHSSGPHSCSSPRFHREPSAYTLTRLRLPGAHTRSTTRQLDNNDYENDGTCSKQTSFAYASMR